MQRQNPEIYEDRVVVRLVQFAVLWAVLGMAVGVWVAAEFLWPTLDFGQFWLSFGRLRPLHTNAVIFGFGVSALMATGFYSVQRTCHVRLFLPGLAWFCCYAWQLVVVLGGLSLLAGWTSTKEYAELEWPFDIAITLIWVCFGIVFFGTIARRRIRPTLDKSYSLYAGAQDAIVQWWYGHNAVGFLLTGGFLGMLYYFLPKQAEQPIWSYRLSVVAFWAFTYSYIWAGPHHLHYNAIPEWVQSLGMVMSLVLLAPSWATLINGVMTVSKAWTKLKRDPALKFIVLSLAFYGLATFEGPMMAIRSVNVVSHFTDWTIGHVHSGALGWNAMVTYGTFYFLVPRLVGAELHSTRLANLHFVLALAGTLLYILAMWASGVSQGLLWLSVDRLGELSFGFRDVMAGMRPYYGLRLVAGLLFWGGTLLMAWNLFMTLRGRRAVAVSPPPVAEPWRLERGGAGIATEAGSATERARA
jgi:cytochrome c oxidase cbb3-type subunit 1